MRSFLSLLVRLFPANFRSQFGSDMVEQIQSDYDRARSLGRRKAWVFAFGTALDLVRAGVSERRNPTWGITPPSQTIEEKGKGMTMSGWTKDLRHAVRALRRSPGFTAVTVVTLGFAIGANAGIFSVVDTVLLNPLPYQNADRLVYITASAPGSDFPEEFSPGAEFYVQYREQAHLLEDVSTFNAFTSTLRADDRTERVWMSGPTTSLFTTLQVSPILGRLPVPEDESQVAVISHKLWTSWFGADSAVIGRSYHIAGSSRTVIGVMGPEFQFPIERVLLWIPRIVRTEAIVPGRSGQPLVARMAPGATIDAVIDELGTLAKRLPERFGGSAQYARLIEQHRPVVRSLEEQLVGSVSAPLWILLGSVGIVLLIACANVANLFMVRTERRQRELAVRRALGATRGQLIRSQLAETVVMAGMAGTLAVVLAWVGVPIFLRAAPPNIPRLDEVGLTVPTLLFTLGASLLSALLCGAVPAIRSSAPNLTSLRDAGRGSTRRAHWGRDALVVGQTALALVLLIGSGLLVRSFLELRNVDPGYDTDDIFTFQIAPGEPWDAPAYARFHMDFMERLGALPGVESVGLVENVPLNETPGDGRFRTDVAAGDDVAATLLRYTWAGGDYYGTMGIAVLRGRAFTREDHVNELGSVIVSRSAADLLWPGEDPIGRRMQQEGSPNWETVIGVVEDVLQSDFRIAPEPLVYFPLVGQPLSPTSRALSSSAYVLKTSRAENIAPEVRALVREVAPEAPMYRVFTMAELAADSMVRLSFTMLTLGIASTLAVMLGAIGLFGVLSYVVAERTQEIGLRMALGAEASRVQRMVVAQGARVVVLGIVIGVVVAVGTTRVLGNLLFGVEAADLGTFVGMAGTMMLVGLLASYMPARRASSVDPIVSLKGD